LQKAFPRIIVALDIDLIYLWNGALSNKATLKAVANEAT
jgi:hypothetical protein